jgi:succinate dehydrogenase / fumarate reductase cytochrome b subunit
MKVNQVKTIKQKALMAVMGLIWVGYLSFHALSNLSFFAGKDSFDNLYIWLNSGIFWRFIMPGILLLAIIYHIFIAVQKQLSNLGKNNKYHKRYPQDIPRFIAWSGVGFLFLFLVVHIYQMQNIDITDSYNEIIQLLSNPIMLGFYLLATIPLLFHIHHGLANVPQTLALKGKLPVNLVLILLVLGFILMPLGVIL